MMHFDNFPNFLLMPLRFYNRLESLNIGRVDTLTPITRFNFHFEELELIKPIKRMLQPLKNLIFVFFSHLIFSSFFHIFILFVEIHVEHPPHRSIGFLSLSDGCFLSSSVFLFLCHQ